MPATNLLEDRIVKLTPHLKRIAYQHASDPMQADDIFQHMVECILTQAKPTDSDSRILTLGTWRARNFREGENTYMLYVSDEGALASEPDEGDDSQDPFETYRSSSDKVHGIEDRVIENEVASELQRLIASLPAENQRLIYLLKAGNSPADIARKLGVSRSAISQKLSTIRLQLGRSAMFQPQGI
jgi:RNA polymerase sigma factor (sigma-70 family)